MNVRPLCTLIVATILISKSKSHDEVKYPRGFWDPQRKWTSLMCQQPEVTDDWLHSCLKDTNIWLYGDSNAKQIYKALLRWIPTKCRRGFCFNEGGTNITYVLHEQPVHSNKSVKIHPKFGLDYFLDMIPSTGRHFVLFHYFLHTSRSHPSSLYLRLQKLKRGITRLLAKTPQAHVAVRGPHTSAMQVHRNHILGGDTLGSYMKALYHETFKDLRDRIVFLDAWDVTVALENTEYHPIEQVANELARTFFAFKCSEKGA